MPKYKNTTTADIVIGQYRFTPGVEVTLNEFLESLPAGITKTATTPCYNPIVHSDLYSGGSGSATVSIPAGTQAFTLRLNCTGGSVSVKFSDSSAVTVLKLASGMSWERFFPSRVVDSIIITYLEASSKVYVTMET